MKSIIRAPRRFQAYGVGLWRTGTYSLTKIFGRYRSAHEFRFEPTMTAVLRHRSGEWPDARLENFLMRRDAARRLEMDSFFLNGSSVRFYRKAFPDARFILTLRDCYSWCEATMNMFLFKRERGADTRRVNSVTRGLLGLPSSDFADRAAAVGRLDVILKTLAEFWSDWNGKILRELPADRVLVVRTHEISNRLDEMASFLGVPARMLSAGSSHENKAPATWRAGVFQAAGYRSVQKMIDLHGGPLMKKYFPGGDIETFCRSGRK